MKIGQKVREKRQLKGLTIVALANMIGAKSETLSKWERGKYRMPADALQKISVALGIGMEELFGGEK